MSRSRSRSRSRKRLENLLTEKPKVRMKRRVLPVMQQMEEPVKASLPLEAAKAFLLVQGHYTPDRFLEPAWPVAMVCFGWRATPILRWGNQTLSVPEGFWVPNCL